jgi:hypothetical protein
MEVFMKKLLVLALCFVSIHQTISPGWAGWVAAKAVSAGSQMKPGAMFSAGCLGISAVYNAVTGYMFESTSPVSSKPLSTASATTSASISPEQEGVSKVWMTQALELHDKNKNKSIFDPFLPSIVSSGWGCFKHYYSEFQMFMVLVAMIKGASSLLSSSIEKRAQSIACKEALKAEAGLPTASNPKRKVQFANPIVKKALAA